MSELKQTKHLLKGDISGIQNFIFNVTSKKAAKSLKARSFFIQKLSEFVLAEIRGRFKDRYDIIYNGGGNFYVEIEDLQPDEMERLQSVINQHTKDFDFYVSLATVEIEDKFGDAWKAVNRKTNLAKLSKYKSSKTDIFKAFSYEPKKKYITLDVIKKYDENGEKNEFEAKIFGMDIRSLFRSENQKAPEESDLFKNIPLWTSDLIKTSEKLIEKVSNSGEEMPDTNDIISFMYLAEFARTRTGTDLIGILKMDVDNLHLLFDGINDKESAKKTSSRFKDFFEVKIFELINKFEEKTNKSIPEAHYNLMKNNIYPVFTGGDDCFFIGAWDYILDFARLVQTEFTNEFNGDKVTLSAAITLCEPHFPVIRFSEIVEDRLSQAKSYPCISKPGCKPQKNAINFMGEVVSWKDLETMKIIINGLYEIISGTPAVRNLLHRIALSAEDFNILQGKALDGKMNFPEIWRLFYTVKRNVKNDNIKREIEQKILNKYETALLDAYTKKISTNPVVFPLAARWVELLTKK